MCRGSVTSQVHADDESTSTAASRTLQSTTPPPHLTSVSESFSWPCSFWASSQACAPEADFSALTAAISPSEAAPAAREWITLSFSPGIHCTGWQQKQGKARGRKLLGVELKHRDLYLHIGQPHSPNCYGGTGNYFSETVLACNCPPAFEPQAFCKSDKHGTEQKTAASVPGLLQSWEKVKCRNRGGFQGAGNSSV